MIDVDCLIGLPDVHNAQRTTQREKGQNGAVLSTGSGNQLGNPVMGFTLSTK